MANNDEAEQGNELKPYEVGALPASEYRKQVLRKSKVTLRYVAKTKVGTKTHIVPLEEINNKREQTIQSEIIKHLIKKGWYVHKAKALNMVGTGDNLRLASTTKGVPDILACAPGGIFVGIEVKNASNKARVSGEQRVQINHIRESGGHAFVAHSIACIDKYLAATENLSKRVAWKNY